MRAFARRTDPATSHEAAARVTPTLTALQKLVLAYARSCGAHGFTDEEMNRHFRTTGSTYRTRRKEMCIGLSPFIVPAKTADGKPLKRKIASGGRAIVWIAREHADDMGRSGDGGGGGRSVDDRGWGDRVGLVQDHGA
jgi:hypothetical protein